MKIILFMVLSYQLFAQSIFDTDVYFEVEKSTPQLIYDNGSFVQWFKTLPPEWKEDLYNQNYVGKNGGYYELTLKTKEWLFVPLRNQVAGVVRFAAIPDTGIFANAWLAVPFDADTNIVDFDSVETTTYYIPVAKETPKRDRIITLKKVLGNIIYPVNNSNFRSIIDREVYLKRHQRARVERAKTESTKSLEGYRK